VPEAVKVNEVLKRFIHLSCFLLVLAGPAQAQLPESEGPYSAEVRNIQFEDTQFDRKQIRARVYWPTLREGDEKASETPFGPFPLVGFMHGWTGSPWHYDALSLHLASWGFIVASIGTETERDGNLKDEARDTQALMHWIASRSEEPEVWPGELTSGRFETAETWLTEWAAGECLIVPPVIVLLQRLRAGNLSSEPHFANATTGDFNLLDTSPGIDGGSNSMVPAGITLDMAQNPRFVDSPVGDTGAGTAPIVDIGAYEVTLPPFVAFCFGDGSGTPCPCGNAGVAGSGCGNNAHTAGCELTASGTPSISNDTLTLTATRSMPSQPGIFFLANNAVGGSIGYQVFFDELRQQVVVELAGRTDTDNSGQAALAAGIRYQKAIGQHLVFVIDSFIANSESRGTSPGARVELLTKF